MFCVILLLYLPKKCDKLDYRISQTEEAGFSGKGGEVVAQENEFELLRETFHKSRINVVEADFSTPILQAMDEMIQPFINGLLPDLHFEDLFYDGTAKKLYCFEDPFTLLYMVFALPIPKGKKAVLIGPYLHWPIGAEKALEISEENGIQPQQQKVITDYFASVPVLGEDSALFLLLDAFCERLWQGSYEIVDVQPQTRERTDGTSVGGQGIDDTFLHMKNMERRYLFENEMMDAVMMGYEHKARQLLSGISKSTFEKRLTDPIRNVKNYGVIMNTLLRKAAEKGGVHPVHLDRMSSQYAVEIEKISSLQQSRQLMSEMFREYCRLVKKHRNQEFSPVIRQAVTVIEADLSAEMNLHILAKELGVSNGYLSAQFKKETGKTVTQYIWEKRLSYAMYLLRSTTLQIQTVAQHCGIMDVHYFSKLFKKHTGKTPSQFRQDTSARR